MLDVDRLAAAVLDGTQALLARELAPLRSDNAVLVARCAMLEERLAEVEAREQPDVPAMLSEAVNPIRIATDQALEIARTLAERPQERQEPAPAPDVASMVAEAVREAVEALPAQDPAEFETLRLLIDDVRKAIPAEPDLTGYATKAEVVAIAGEVAGVALTHVATKDDLAAVIEAIPALPEPLEMPEVDLSPFATKEDVEAVRRAIPEPAAPADLSGLATKDDLAEVRGAIPAAPDMTGFATKADVEDAIATIKIPEAIRGKDGVGWSEARTNDDGELILKLTTGETFNVGRVRGYDGFSLEDFSVEYDGERTIALIFAKSGRVERHEIVLPIPIDRGVYREGQTYDRGDAVSFGGSMHIAQEPTADRPETSKAWRLAVKRGRDMTGAK
jgi:hypothetical protein